MIPLYIVKQRIKHRRTEKILPFRRLASSDRMADHSPVYGRMHLPFEPFELHHLSLPRIILSPEGEREKERERERERERVVDTRTRCSASENRSRRGVLRRTELRSRPVKLGRASIGAKFRLGLAGPAWISAG